MAELIQAIETFLVGAGNPGTALLGDERFSKFGLLIVAAIFSLHVFEAQD